MQVTKAAQGLVKTVTVLTRSGLLGPIRPDRLIGMVGALWGESVSATTAITVAAKRTPDRVAIVDERGTLTWGELSARADALAVGLAALPGGSPKTVAIMCRNHRGLVEAIVAAGRLGSTTLLLNTGFAGPQLREVLAREDVDLLVHDEEFTELLGSADQTGDTQLRRVVGWIDGDSDSDGDGDGGADGSDPAGPTVDGLIERNRGNRPGPAPRPPRLVLLTSGTTGTPKGARLSAKTDFSALVYLLDRIPWRTGETVVVAAPIFHAWGFGQLLIAATMSCTVVMRRRFDPEATLNLVATHRATGLGLVPVMLERITDLPPAVLNRYDLSTLRFATASGSRMRPDAVTTFMDLFGDVVYNSYNATEAGLITTAVPADLRIAADTSGRPVEGTEIRILDGEHRELPRGEVGRVFVRNNSQFDGYTNGQTKAFHDGFMCTGDLGRYEDSGLLFVVGREDDMIVSGGENVYPQEVEDTLAGHDSVLEASVVGVDDPKFGQRLAAFVVLRPGAEVTPDALKKHVRDTLAGYKVPRSVTVLDELPRGTTGKILKRELVERASDG